MTNRNTRSLDEPVGERPADLRLYRVAATPDDREFYVRCADFASAAEVVIQRAIAKRLPLVHRPIVEVTGG